MSATAEQLPLGMRPAEYDRLRELLDKCQPRATLETGLANGGSAVILCEWHSKNTDGKHTAIDPFQSAPKPKGFENAGVNAVASAGQAHRMTVIEDFGHLALPRLVEEGRKFQFVLIDGYHSFDYTLLDLFYADLLLDDGGIVAVHDTGMPAVYKACRFLETQKPYDKLSPPIGATLASLPAKVLRRVGQMFNGTSAAYAERRTKWFSLAAYRKQTSRLTDEWSACDF
jgi:cephalosporin hydroxylase